MPYIFAAESFQTYKLCSRLSLRKVHFLDKNGQFSFLSPLRGLGATYAVHLRLIEKHFVPKFPVEGGIPHQQFFVSQN